MREMTDLLVLDLVEKGLVTKQLVLTVGYDIENLKDPERRRAYHGEVVTDHYGRRIPKHAHGTANLEKPSSSTKIILQAMTDLFDRIVDPNLLVRRLTVVAANVMEETFALQQTSGVQLDLFTDVEQESVDLEKEKRMQQTVLAIKQKYGKNAILRGMNLEEGATAKDRNRQIGGHKA